VQFVAKSRQRLTKIVPEPVTNYHEQQNISANSCNSWQKNKPYLETPTAG
jgi:hypothetical protein